MGPNQPKREALVVLSRQKYFRRFGLEGLFIIFQEDF